MRQEIGVIKQLCQESKQDLKDRGKMFGSPLTSIGEAKPPDVQNINATQSNSVTALVAEATKITNLIELKNNPLFAQSPQRYLRGGCGLSRKKIILSVKLTRRKGRRNYDAGAMQRDSTRGVQMTSRKFNQPASILLRRVPTSSTGVARAFKCPTTKRVVDSNQGSSGAGMGLPITAAMAFHSNIIQPAGHTLRHSLKLPRWLSVRLYFRDKTKTISQFVTYFFDAPLADTNISRRTYQHGNVTSASQMTVLLEVVSPTTPARTKLADKAPKSAPSNSKSIKFLHDLPTRVTKTFILWDYSLPTKANRVLFPASKHLDFHMWESWRTMLLVGGFFSGISNFPAGALRHCCRLTPSHPQRLSTLMQAALPTVSVTYRMPSADLPRPLPYTRRSTDVMFRWYAESMLIFTKVLRNLLPCRNCIVLGAMDGPWRVVATSGRTCWVGGQVAKERRGTSCGTSRAAHLTWQPIIVDFTWLAGIMETCPAEDGAMCFRPLRQLDSVGAEFLAVAADNLNVAAALGAVLVNTTLALCVLRRRSDLVLLLSLACADLLAGVAVAVRIFSQLFRARYPDLDGAVLSVARHLLLFAATTASLLSIAAIAVGARWKGATSRRKRLRHANLYELSIQLLVDMLGVMLNGDMSGAVFMLHMYTRGRKVDESEPEVEVSDEWSVTVWRRSGYSGTFRRTKTGDMWTSQTSRQAVSLNRITSGYMQPEHTSQRYEGEDGLEFPSALGSSRRWEISPVRLIMDVLVFCRKQWLLVAGVWSASTVIGATLVLVGGWGTWSSEECSSSGVEHATQLLLWVCLTHLFVVVVVAAAAAASWGRTAAAAASRESEETQGLDGEGAPTRPAPADHDFEFGLVAVVVCYALCWLPYAVASLLRLTEPKASGCCSSLLQHLFFGVGAINYAIKPFLYAWGILGRRRRR
ncbi:hypothetical protein PR048_019769 [Dryococelus australis]|uniref:G-protein coupled receptors family 1 profile domain-containing protein n=1 Tax=Dryococelus australis TaxID=614101 RepID=A0ABQ9H4E5_9NEOP|nr:hypothetical protein PR048_019769 [Dryococelus australis]